MLRADTYTRSVQSSGSGLRMLMLFSVFVTALAADVYWIAQAHALSGRETAASGSTPSAPPGPITITQGGIYVGHWVSTGSTPAVRINTTAPVTIQNSLVENYDTGVLIHAEPGSEVTISGVTGRGGAGRFFLGNAVKSARIRNNTLERTAGIYFLSAQADATIVVTRNKQRNLQTPPDLVHSSFCQFDKVTTAAIDVSWNEVINTFGKSMTSGDMISIYESAFAKVHDNYVEGAYPSAPDGSHSGSGVMIDSAGAHDNEVYLNQIVATTNAGIGISSGWNNRVHHNRLVSDGKLSDGTSLAAANVGVYVWNASGDPGWSNNRATGNVIGWIRAGRYRNDMRFQDAPSSDYALNRRLANPITFSTESKEHRVWLAKVKANRVRIGA